MHSSIKSIKVPSITPYEKNINAKQGMAIYLSFSIR
jgi:hypothetical protein